jgi:uncharacterized Zn-binding protein involved in type VI secretion
MFSAARLGDSTDQGGSINNGSSSVFVNNIPASAAKACSVSSWRGTAPIGCGSGSVFIHNYPAARYTDVTDHGEQIVSGSDNVFIGG